jgi:hypothetical protein
MPQRVSVMERYWGCCWRWYIPFPGRKRRTVKKWKYEWLSLKETGYGVFSKMVGCEQDNICHKWTTFSFNVWGSTTVYHKTKYYHKKRPDNGPYEGEPVVHPKVIDDIDWKS